MIFVLVNYFNEKVSKGCHQLAKMDEGLVQEAAAEGFSSLVFEDTLPLGAEVQLGLEVQLYMVDLKWNLIGLGKQEWKPCIAQDGIISAAFFYINKPSLTSFEQWAKF